MNKKKMFLKDPIPKKNDKNNKFTEKKEQKQPLLQFFFKNNKKEKLIDEKSSISKTPKTSKFNSSFNFNFQKKKSETNIKEKNVTPIKKLKNNRYFFINNGQFKKDNDINSLIIENEINEKQNKYINNHIYESRNNNRKNNRNTRSITLNNNNSLFPNLNGNSNLFRLQKKVNEEINLEDKNKPNDLIYNNINLKNFNSNSIFVGESRPKKFTFFEKFLGDKISSQKSVNANNANSFKNLNSEESNLKKFSHFRINTEIIDKNDNILKTQKGNKRNYSKKVKFNLLLQNSELNKRLINPKSFQFNSLRNNNIKINKPILTETNLEIKKKKNLMSILPRNDIKSLKFSMQAFSQDKTLSSPNENNNNKRRIFFMKNKQKFDINNDYTISKLIKSNRIETHKNSNYFSNNENENISINNINTHNPLGRIYNSFINKNRFNVFKERNSFVNKEIFINNGSEDFGGDNDMMFLRPKQQYRDSCSIYLFEDEEKFLEKKRSKMNKKIKYITKLKHKFNLSNKKDFLSNFIINKIKQTIFDEEAIAKLKEEERKRKFKIMQKYLLEIFYFILGEPNEIYNLEKIDNLGLYFFIDKGINTEIKIRYNLGFLNMNKEYAKDIEEKWNKDNEINYKKICEFYCFKMIANAKKFSFFETIDKKFFLIKELVRKEYNSYFDTIHFNVNKNSNVGDKNTKNVKIITKENKKERFSTKKIKNLPLRKSQTLNLSPRTIKKLQSIKENIKDKSSSDGKDGFDKASAFTKIKNEFEIKRDISKTITQIKINIPKKEKKKINIANIINNNSKDSKDKTEKEIAFTDASLKVDKFNVLKNIELFFKKKKKENIFEDKKIFNFNLIKNLNVDEILNKFNHFKLTEDASELKNEESKKDSSEEKLLNKLISILNKKDIDQYFSQLQNNEKYFPNIINKKEQNTGNTLLIYAVENNLKSIAESLLVKGADPNIQNISGDTALHLAYKNNNSFMVNLLIEYNADQTKKNNNDKLPGQMH